MWFDGWLFSARLAWGRNWIKAATIVAILLSLGVSAWFLTNVIPAARSNGTVAYHYTIYFGIDDLRAWWWVFAMPIGWIGLTIVDLLWAFGSYRQDPILSSTLFAMVVLWGLPWTVSLFYLAMINISL